MTIKPIQNILSTQLLQQQLNANFESLEGAQPGYAHTLPLIADTPDGRLFYQGSDSKLYQAQSGSWVVIT